MTTILQRSSDGVSGWSDIPGTTDLASYTIPPGDLGYYYRVKDTVGGISVYSTVHGPVVSSGGGGSTLHSTLGFNTLAFSDDFIGSLGDIPDTSKWAFKSGHAGNGVQTWGGNTYCRLDGNSNVDVVMHYDTGTAAWISAFMSGKIPYGGSRFMEARAKVPSDLGCWAAPIWEWDSPFGSLGIENDVIEQLAREPTNYHTTLHDPSATQKGISVNTGVTLASDYHLYQCAVYSDHANFYFDDTLLSTIRPSDLGGAWDFVTTSMVLNINFNIGGWGGTISNNNDKHMLVDYVKVWN